MTSQYFQKTPYSRDRRGRIEHQSRYYLLGLLDRNLHSSYQLMYCHINQLGNPPLPIDDSDYQSMLSESSQQSSNLSINNSDVPNAAPESGNHNDAEEQNVSEPNEDLNRSYEVIVNEPPTQNRTMRQSTLAQQGNLFQPPTFPTVDFQQYQNFESNNLGQSPLLISPHIGEFKTKFNVSLKKII